MVWLPDCEKKFEDVFIRFDRIHERDEQMNRHRMTAQAALAQHRTAKTNICNAKFGDMGSDGDRVKNSQWKIQYLELLTLICLFTMQLLYGYDDE